MKKISKKKIFVALGFAALFVLWTVLLGLVDVDNVGPRSSHVGFSSLNSAFHSLTGVHMTLYVITDWLGLVPLGIAFAYAVFGFIQLCKRKSLFKVDKSILVLGVFYVAVIFIYVFFENVVINYRPVLINGYLEVSYPSSTTLLTMCVMPTCQMELSSRIKKRKLNLILTALICGFTAFMVICRLISGVHWITDIIGGGLISAALVLTYSAFRGETSVGLSKIY